MTLSKLDAPQHTPSVNTINEPRTAVSDEQETSPDEIEATHLLGPLRWLDRLIERAMAEAEVVYGSQASTDPYRGLYIGQEEVNRLLECEPGAATFHINGEEGEAAHWQDSSRLSWLAEAFGLSRFDLEVVLISLAPELDLRYERFYAYLQDNVTRRRPTVDLTLNLLCSSATAKLARRAHFATHAPLIRQRLIHLIPEANHVRPPLLAHYLKLDEQVISLLLGDGGLDARLEEFCQLIMPDCPLDASTLSDQMAQGLLSLIKNARETREPLRLHFQGPRGAGKRQTAEALACAAGARLLAADLRREAETEMSFERLLGLLFREAWFQDVILYLEGLDALRLDEHAVRLEQLLEAVAEYGGVVILADTQPWTPAGRSPLGVISMAFPVADFESRKEHWAAYLAAEGVTLADSDLSALASRFRLTESRIADAVATACNSARLRAGRLAVESGQDGAQITTGDLFAAARRQSGHELAALARKIEPFSSWSEIVLPPDSLAQLREIGQRVAHSHRVLGAWGFGRKLSAGKGVNALFAGPSGTGKTMAADILASELGLDLYKIDLAGVVSKYIGETEKNLDRIFKAAEDANAILFFDEADALFGKRSEVRDSHDRYANIEISYLLQKMEAYEGIAILATNLRQNMDESFVRRLAFTIHFPFPDEESRRRIWVGIWPAQTPLAPDADMDFLARQFKLSGGNIKNIALAAAFLAAEEGGEVTMSHLLHATRREYQKIGKAFSEAEMGSAAAGSIKTE